MGLRVITADTMTLDGRIAASPSVPSWQDERWRPILEAGFQLIDFAALHGALGDPGGEQLLCGPGCRGDRRYPFSAGGRAL